jgi:hypothetical protein
MEKKRDRRSYTSKKAQVTIFIILGIVIMLGFIFVIGIVGDLTRSELEESKEKVLSQIFEKEALRIYVQDCLDDSLTEGILLLGKQGGIWKDQGGRKIYSDETGVTTADGERVMFAITKENIDPENKYPCRNSDPEPRFCQYEYPRTDLFYGNPTLFLSSLERDLRLFLESNIKACIDNRLTEGAAEVEDIETQDDGSKFSLSIFNDGVNVKVHYPLTLGAGGDEYFQVSDFDFFYTTQLGSLVKAAVLNPLSWDVNYIDFDYNPDNWGETFSFGSIIDTGENCAEGICNKPLQKDQYDVHGITFSKSESPGYDVFEFKPSWEHPKLQNFVFRFARENRAPALDYISRCSTEDYDYLVVRDVPNGDFNKVMIKDITHDPDEDDVRISFPRGVNFQKVGDIYEVTPPAGVTEWNLKVSATDGDLEDWQDVHVKVDSMVTPGIVFKNLVDETKPLSLEDPVCIQIISPDVEEVTSFSFSLKGNPITLQIGENGLVGLNGNGFIGCDIANYDHIRTIKINLARYFDLGDSSLLSSSEVTYHGDAACKYEIDVPTDFTVTTCTPYENPDFPHPYIVDDRYPRLKDLYKYKNDGSFEDFNYYFATNKCCDNNGNLKGSSETCFEGDGCFGNDEHPEFYLYSLEKKCGDRGNICNGEGKPVKISPPKNICGKKTMPLCSQDIEDRCQEKEAWSMIEDEGWCYDNFDDLSGCGSFCSTAVVDRLGIASGYVGTTFKSTSFSCGCSNDDARNSRACDSNFDGEFKGTCKFGNRCVGDD